MQKEAATGAMGGQRTFSRKRRLKNQIENVLKTHITSWS